MPAVVRLAVRNWRSTPLLAALVVVTLALGIGTTTTAFGLAHSVLLQPLPFPAADRLVWITSYNTRTGGDGEFVLNSNRMAQFLDWQRELTTFEQLAAWGGTNRPDVSTITGHGRPERVNSIEVTQQLLPMLGATTVAGRLFVPGEDGPGAAATVVLAQDYWQRRFDARPDVVGTAITIDNRPHTVVGVIARDFPLPGTLFGGEPIDIYLPLEVAPAGDEIGYFMTVAGRLRAGIGIEQARADLATRQAALGRGRADLAPVAQHVTPLAKPLAAQARTPVLLLFGGIGCVLLMACANIANLLLVRASGRRREMQVRAALGATVRRLIVQTTAESALLVAIGAGAGLALAAGMIRVLRTATWLELPRLAEVHVGWSAIAFTLALGAVTTLVFGSLPLLHLRQRDLVDGLRPHAGVTAAPRAVRAQQAALAAQVAVALLLTVAGGLLLRSLVGLLRVDPGFRTEGVVAMRVDPAGRVPMAQRFSFFSAVLDSVRAVPGVQSAALTMNLPMDRNMTWDVSLPGRAFDPATDGAFARLVSPGYFRTVGIPIVEGRDFDSRDRRDAQWVMAINQTLARRLSALGRDPLGARFVVNGTERQVVAVVADVKHETLAGESGREFYIPQAQAPAFFQTYDLVIRADQPLSLVPDVREAIWRVSADQAIGNPIALRQLIDRTLFTNRLLAALVGGFAVISLLLAGLGVYGVVTYRVASRRKEIAIRVALGSQAWRVRSTVLRDTLGSVAAGLTLGVPLALGAGVAVRSYLFGVDAADVTTLVAASATVLAAALLAAGLPARRAPRLDPIAALRAD